MSKNPVIAIAVFNNDKVKGTVTFSENFKNKSQIANHQSIYKLLSSEMGEKKDNKLHALSLVTKTPEEWSELNKTDFKIESPKCMGGENRK